MPRPAHRRRAAGRVSRGLVNGLLALAMVGAAGVILLTGERLDATRGWLHETWAALLDATPPFPAEPPPARPEAVLGTQGAPSAEAITALAQRVGVVTEPRALLLARAWNARYAGTGDGLEQAITAAERAVVRLPADPEALALLAELYAEAGRDPELRRSLAASAQALAPETSTTLAALAAVAWADSNLTAGHEAAMRCLRSQADEPLCQWWELRTEADGTPDSLAAWDTLMKRWPANHALLRDAAIHAASVDAPDAATRLKTARNVLREDARVRIAHAEWAHRHGDDTTAATLVRGLGAQAPAAVVIDLAAAALARGDVGAARGLLNKIDETALDTTVLTGAASMPRLRVVQAQMRYLVAAQQPGDARALEAAQAASRSATDLGRSAPAAVQVRVLTGILSRDFTTARTALDGVEPGGMTGRDLARLWLSGVALDVAQGVARSAGPSLDKAIAADPRLPEVHLWRARVALVGEDVGATLAALDQAIPAVDGTDARRDPGGLLLPVPCPVAEIRLGLERLVGSDVTRQARLARGLVLLDWLDEDADAALRGLRALGPDTWSADLHALHARLLLGRGDAAGALAAAEQAVGADPGRSEWRLVRARALVAMGRDSEALADLNPVKSSGKAGSLALSLEAEILERSRDDAGAQRAAAAAVRADPADQVARALAARLGVGG